MDFYEIENISEKNEFIWEFNLDNKTLYGAGLNFKILSHYFDFTTTDWYVAVHGVAQDNLILVHSTLSPVSPPRKIGTENLISENISSLVSKYNFFTLQKEDLLAWGFKEPYFDSEAIGWEGLPHQDEITVVELHDDYFFGLNFPQTVSVKKFLSFILEESFLFLNLKVNANEMMYKENLFLQHLSESQKISTSLKLSVNRHKKQITLSYQAPSKNKLKSFFGIKDVIECQLI